MSCRPSSMRKSTRAAASNGYCVIGDTAAAVIYVNRMLNNGITAPIHILIEGVDRITQDGINNVSFAVDNMNRSLHFLEQEQIHMIPAEGLNTGFATSGTTGAINAVENRVVTYSVGSGVMGDVIAAYYIPRFGPWFPAGTDTRFNTFVYNSTKQLPLNSAETIVSNNIQNYFTLATSNSNVIVKSPSQLFTEYALLTEDNGEFYRELYLDMYAKVNSATNVTFHSNVSDIDFTNGTAPGLYNVTGHNIDDVINDVTLVWKTNPYAFLRISNNGNLIPTPKPINVPTSYRAVISIPQDNPTSGVNLSMLDPTGDLVTSFVTFSIQDIHNTNSSPLVWLCAVYTAVEDLSIVTQQGTYASAGNTLLIVESVNVKNKRVTTYNVPEQEIQVFYNDRVTETSWLRSFAEIVAGVYNAYTGLTISVDSLLGYNSVCNNICIEENQLTDVVVREMPIVTMIQTETNLYNNTIYPTAGRQTTY